MISKNELKQDHQGGLIIPPSRSIEDFRRWFQGDRLVVAVGTVNSDLALEISKNEPGEHKCDD